MKEILKNKLLYIVSLLCIIVDQSIKLFITNHYVLYESKIIIKDFFNITYVENIGAAWSILSGNVIFLIFITLLVISALYDYLIKDKKLSKNDLIIYGLLYGGIFGNLIDRIVRGFVVDYLDFTIFKYDFPVFNFADTLIVIAMILIGIKQLRGDKNANKN